MRFLTSAKAYSALQECARALVGKDLAGQKLLLNIRSPDANSVPMLHFRGETGWIRVIALGCIVSVLFAIALSVAPQLHGWLHRTSSANHECAAMLIASGSCEHSVPPQGAPKLENAPNSPAFLPQRFQSVIAAVPSSIQEHAPPASH